MTEQQVWFLLIFSIPFIPALLVFKLIKPKSGDAKVGGRIPIVKDLQIELGGAIATYVVIVLVALLSFSMIIEDKRLVVRIEPLNAEGHSIGIGDVNIEKLIGSSFDLAVRSENGDRFLLSGNDFKFDSNKIMFEARPELYVRSRTAEGRVYFLPTGSRFVSGPQSETVLPATKNGEYSFGLEMEADLLADWIARVDLLWITVGRNKVDTEQLTVLEDNSTNGISRVRFGATNVSGLTEIETNAWDGTNEVVERFLAEMTAATETVGPDTSAVLRNLGNALIDAHNGRRIDRGEWKSTDPRGLTKSTGPDDPAVYFVVAPSKRIDLPNAKSGRFVVIREKTTKNFSIETSRYNPSIVYAHATKIGAIFIKGEPDVTLDHQNAPQITGAGRAHGSIQEENLFRGPNQLGIVGTDLPKEAAVSVKL